ncbi:glycosyltransferase family 2 protein [Falsiroseomonas sp. HW251]|uniref:glycosyltransferase family 2 protein n=1 Tax=Falsiroseomonas sp. HW251 TaxID=3390998 RepID=UPI003D31DB09
MAPPRDAVLDVIVPVHDQRAMVEPCLASVLAARNDTPSELVVIDDGSTDEALKASLAALAAEGRITLLTNERNLGFTGTVNRGMRLHPDRDLILLNSDTLVFGDWIDRLRRAAHSGPRVATANPLTNASHIGSYPFRRADGQVRFEISDAELDALAATLQPPRRVATHVTVGFCQYIRRAVIDEIGVFDAENFPVGYGEESDFCYRARRLGWRHVVTGDVFVRHWEGQSFGDRKAKLMASMIETFNRLHPDLAANDRDFAQRDPVRPLREALDLARLKRLLGGAATLPCLDEAGAERATAPALVMDAQRPVARLAAPGVPTMASLPSFALPGDVVALNTVLAGLGILALVFDEAVQKDRFAGWVRGRPGEATVEAVIRMSGRAA